MVPTIVIAGVIIGMITIVPSALADNDKDDDDWKACKKWFFEAFRDFRKHGFISPEIRTLTNQCLSEGHKSPWKLPTEENVPSVLSGLSVEFVKTEAEIPNGSEIIEQRLNPCPSGKIIIDEPLVEMSVFATLSTNIMTDRTTLLVSSLNKGSAGTLILVTPCLGVIEN